MDIYELKGTKYEYNRSGYWKYEYQHRVVP
jgi:hypothetical protein